MEYRFILPKGSKKTTCPYCGRPRCFKPYVDSTTGEVLHPSVGRCDHEVSCPQKHYSPRQFFKDNPDFKLDNNYIDPPCGSGTAKYNVLPQPLHQTEFFPLEWAEKAVERQSTFRTWFLSLPYSEERKAEVLREYYVGGMAKDTIVQGVNYGPAAIFWMIDAEQRVHDAKMIAYTPDGHRVQNWGNSMRSVCEKARQGPQLQWTEKSLFGLHLTARYPDRVVCIVESEKTALICACRYPQYLWLATGGCGNLQKEKLAPLMHRQLVIYPDSGELEKWRTVMVASGHKNYRMVEYLENFEPNTDIADVILGTANALEF